MTWLRHAWIACGIVCACGGGDEQGSDTQDGDASTSASATNAGTTTTGAATNGNATVTGTSGGSVDGTGGTSSTTAAASDGGASSSAQVTSSSTSQTSSSGGSGGDPGVMGEPVEEALAPLLVPRGEHGVAALDGEIYVLGGFTPSVTSTVHVYNPEADAWREVADFPVEFHHPNVAVVDGVLYVLGFHATSAQRIADGSTYAYDPDADEWTQLSSQPEGTERGASCVTTLDGKIYVFGGTNGDALTYASYYDPVEDRWQDLPDIPLPRHHCLAAPHNGKIYLVSGRDVVIEEVQPESFVFDPVAETYDEVAPIPTPRGGAAGGALGDLVYTFGGEGNPDDPSGVFPEVEQYDPVSDTWSSLPEMTVPRHGFQAAVIGQRMYLPGGSISQGLDPTTAHTVFYLDAE